MSQPSNPGAAPVTGIKFEAGEIPNSYIVLMKERVNQSRHAQFMKSLETKYQPSNGCKVTHEYGADGAFNGYSVTLKGDPYRVLSSSLCDIEKICPDTIAGCDIDIPGNDEPETDDGQLGYDMHEEFIAAQGNDDDEVLERRNVPWGLQRISQRNRLPEDSRPGDLSFTFRRTRSFRPIPVDVYVLDTGLNIQHREFGDRARWGENFTGTGNRDIHGHGTHVAGTIAGSRLGIAQEANIISVKVIGDRGFGPASAIIAGIDWSVKNARSTGRASVINLSLVAHQNDLLDLACSRAVAAGVHVCAAAGNANVRAHNWSPAGATGVITVGTTTIRDTRRYDSNFGPAVDIFAPGCEVISAGVSSRTAHKKLSGSSMATAHVAGGIANRISLEGNRAPDAMLKRLRELGTSDALSDIPKDTDTVNLLLGNGVSR